MQYYNILLCIWNLHNFSFPLMCHNLRLVKKNFTLDFPGSDYLSRFHHEKLHQILSQITAQILSLRALHHWILHTVYVDLVIASHTISIMYRLLHHVLVLFRFEIHIKFLHAVLLSRLDENHDISAMTEILIAVMVFIALFYVIMCFVRNRDDIVKLVDELDTFKKFGTPPDLSKINKQIAWFTIFFMTYSVMGTLVYVSVPFTTLKECEALRSQYMKDFGIPCGLTLMNQPMPFKYDFSPRKELIIFYQAMICTTCTTYISALTLLLFGMLMQITTQLRYLGSLLENSLESPKENVGEMLHTYVQFHGKIILYANKTNKAFSSMMLFHITVTSLVISTLGYQILVSGSYTYSIRYLLHLGGWLVLLFLVCYNGQRLICESTSIAKNVYFGPWYNYPVPVQRDVLLIIARAQRPLSLSAWNFGIISLPTYLQVLSTAYSYFMLLLKLKS